MQLSLFPLPSLLSLRGAFGRVSLLHDIIRKTPMTEQNQYPAAKVNNFLPQNPNDACRLTGIALECLREGDIPARREHASSKPCWKQTPITFQAIQMYAQPLAQPIARKSQGALGRGIAAANRSGNQACAQKSEGLLTQLG